MPRTFPALILYAALTALPVAHAQTVLRFVDADQGVGLEYWQKDTELPDGGMLYWRGPKTVYVDGKPQEYARYQADDIPGEDAATAGAVQEFLDELDGRDTGANAEIVTERASEVLRGFKAEVRGAWDSGRHRLEPGGIVFTFAGNEVQSSNPAVSQEGLAGLRVACRPLEISVAARPGTMAHLTLSVKSGDALVMSADSFDAREQGGGCAVRLYLPESEQPYEIETNLGIVTVVHGAEAADLRESAGLKPGWQVRVDKHAVLFYGKGDRAAAVSPPPETGKPALFLFTDRNREVYGEGETVEFSLRRHGKVDGDAMLRIAGAGSPLTLPVPGGMVSGEIRLDTSLLRPGDYQVEVSAGDVVSNPLRLTVAGALQATNLKLFSLSKWGSSSYEPRDLELAVQNGLNMVCHGASYGQGGAILGGSPFDDTTGLRPPKQTQRPRDPNRLKDWQGPGFPVELLELKDQHDRGVEFLLRHGLATAPITGGAILYFNVGDAWAHHAADRYQAIQHFGQEWRRFPNFAGMIHCTGDGPTPASRGMVWAAPPGAFDIIHDQRIAMLKDRVQQQVGALEVDSQSGQAELDRINKAMVGAVGFGVGTELGITVQGDARQKLVWTTSLNDLYPRTFGEQRQALAAMMPEPIVNSGTTWGQGSGNGMWTESFYTPLDNPVSDFHGDYGIFPFSYVSGVDLLNLGQGKRPWMSLDLLPERTFPNGMKKFLQAMSRNPAGIGSLQTKAGHIAGGWGATKEHGEQMAVLIEIGKRFGDLLQHLERRDEIAVFASFRQAALGGQDFARLWGAHFLVSKAGYQANFVSERQCLDDPAVLSKYKAVFLVDLTAALPPETQALLLDYQKQGGVLLATERTTIDLAGLIKVNSGSVRGANEVKYKHVYVGFEPHIEGFKATVPGVVEPFFTADQEDVHLSRSVDGDLEYWTLFHDGIVDKHNLADASHSVQFLYKGTTASLTAKRGGVLYDTLRREEIVAAVDRGSMAWDVDLTDISGTYYLVAPRPLARLEALGSQSVRAGKLFSFTAGVADDQGKVISGRLPLELVVTDPAGTERYRLYRTTQQELLLKIAVNDPIGRWTWQATEQATGLRAEGAFVVDAADRVPSLTRPEALVYDRAAIESAVQKRSFEILLFPEQAALLETAEALQQKLSARGVACEVRLMSPSEVRNYPMSWNERTIEEKEIHAAVLAGRVLGRRVGGTNQLGTKKSGPDFAFYNQYVTSAPWVYYKDVVLLGQRDLPGNPLLEQIGMVNRMLPRNPSPSFPAAGEGMLGYAWAPFHYGHDAIVAYGADAAGLDKALATLVELAGATPAPEPGAVPLLGRGALQTGQVYEALGFVAERGDTKVTGAERERLSLMPPLYPIVVEDAVTAGGKVFLKQRGKADTKTPPFVAVDLGVAQAQRYQVQGGEPSRGSADDFRRALRGETFPHSRILTLKDGTIEPLERGIARYDSSGKVVWYTEPVPAAVSYAMGKYPYRCQNLMLSGDGRSLLATFYDLNKGGGYGQSLRVFNQPVTLLLDAATGQERCRIEGYLGARLAIAADGSSFAIFDSTPGAWGREVPNPDGGSVLGVFGSDGKRRFVADVGPIDRLSMSADGRLVLASYDDTRKQVTVVDVPRGVQHSVSYPRIDTGLAVDPAGRFGVIAYADGLVRKVEPDGRLLADMPAGVAGFPLLDAAGQLLLCGYDARIHFPGTDREPLPFGDPEPEVLPLPMQAFRAGGMAPRPPFWKSLRGSMAPVDKGDAFPASSVDGKTHAFSVDVPACKQLGVYLVDFTYALKQPGDRLQVQLSAGKQQATYLYPYSSAPQHVSLPLRRAEAGPVTLRFESQHGVQLSGGQGRFLGLSGCVNAAKTSTAGTGANVPRLIVPPTYGYSPGAYKIAYNFPSNYKRPLPPDLKPGVKGDIFSLFSGDHLAANPLFPCQRAGVRAWEPPSTTPTLAGAWVILEFTDPVEATGLGVWQHPFDLPVSDYMIEYGNSFQEIKNAEFHEVRDDFKIADVVWGNTDYYRLHQFREPIKARFWRITIVSTPAAVQRFAEIELYQDAFDSLLDMDMNIDGF